MMSENDSNLQKTPVHSVVLVICDILTPLSNDERVRSLDAVRSSLGMMRPEVPVIAGLVGEFGRSLRQEQLEILINTLDVGQKLMFMEIIDMARGIESASPTAAS